MCWVGMGVSAKRVDEKRKDVLRFVKKTFLSNTNGVLPRVRVVPLGPSSIRQTALSGARFTLFKTRRPLGLVVCGMTQLLRQTVSHVPAPNKSKNLHKFRGHLGPVLGLIQPTSKGIKQINFNDRSSINSFPELTASRLASIHCEDMFAYPRQRARTNCFLETGLGVVCSVRGPEIAIRLLETAHVPCHIPPEIISRTQKRND